MALLRDHFTCLLSLFLALTTYLATPTLAQQTVTESYSGTFSGSAVYVIPSQLTAASQAVCPASAPVSCSPISEPDYCCSSGTYCAYGSGSVVGCCPTGQTCSGAIGVEGQSTWVQSSTWVQTTTTTSAWQQTTVYATPGTTTVYGGGGVIVPAGETTVYVQTTTAQQTTNYNGVYCSTLYAKGPGLPTTRAGDCGTILVVNKAARSVRALGVFALPLMILHILGGLLLHLRL